LGLSPDSKVAKECGVCKRTIDRWDEQPELGFPPPVWINGRKYRDTDLLAAFIAARVRASMMERPKPRAKRLKQLKQFADQPATEAR
jgi:DNA-binding transcriptional MerR regulator